MIQQAILRFRSPIRFGDEFTRRRYYEREWLPAYQKQRCQYAVAPRVTLRVDERTALLPGSEVTLGLLDGHPEKSPGLRLLELVESGHVIERKDTPKDAA